MMPTTLTEKQFQKRLADLIKRYEAAHPDYDPNADDAPPPIQQEWEKDWEGLLYEASEYQAKRMDALLTLHLRNEHDSVYHPDDWNRDL